MSRADQKSFAVDVSGKIGDFVDVGTHAKVDLHENDTVSFTSNRTELAAIAYKAGRLQNVSDVRWIFEPEVVKRSTDAIALATPRLSTFAPAPGVVLVAVDEAAVFSVGSHR